MTDNIQADASRTRAALRSALDATREDPLDSLTDAINDGIQALTGDAIAHQDALSGLVAQFIGYLPASDLIGFAVRAARDDQVQAACMFLDLASNRPEVGDSAKTAILAALEVLPDHLETADDAYELVLAAQESLAEQEAVPSRPAGLGHPETSGEGPLGFLAK